jgi:hypothetical protein
MKLSIFRNLTLVTLVSLLLVSCIRDLEETIDKLNKINRAKFNPEFAGPLLYSRLTIADMIDESPTNFLEIDDENLIHIVYRGELISLEAKDFAAFSTQKLNTAVTLSTTQINELITNGSAKITYSTVFDYGITDMEIDSVYMNICGFVTRLSTDLQHDISLKVTIPEIKILNNPFTAIFDLPYNGGSKQLVKVDSLNSSFFDLTKSGDLSHSQLRADIEITVTETNGNSVSATDEIRFNNDFLYNEYEIMFGDVGDVDISPDEADTISFGLFENSNSTGLGSGTFTINDPQLKVIMSNSYGAPIEGVIKQFSTYSDKYGYTAATGYPDPIVIPVPDKTQIGKTLSDSFTLDKTNSNLSSLVSNLPDKFVYHAGILINPPGTIERNFVLYDSKVTFVTDIDIGLYGSADGFVIEQDQPLELDFEQDDSTLGDKIELESATLRLYTENEFPLDLGLQVYFLDSSDNVLDSLIQPFELFLESPEIDQDGRVIGNTTKTLDFKINKARLDNLKKTATAKIRGTFNTYKDGSGTQPEVKLYSDYSIFVKISVEAKALMDIRITE